jgi:hypothetical protein
MKKIIFNRFSNTDFFSQLLKTFEKNTTELELKKSRRNCVPETERNIYFAKKNIYLVFLHFVISFSVSSLIKYLIPYFAKQQKGEQKFFFGC